MTDDTSWTVPEWLGIQQKLHPGDQRYYTPEQIKGIREYGQALMMGGKGRQPVNVWTQGVSNLIGGLAGMRMQNQAAEREKQLNNIQAQQAASMFPKKDYPTSSIGPESPGSDPGNLSPSQRAPQTGGDVLSRAGEAISGIESSGNYNLKGPIINNPRSAYYGDRAYGKYQVMGKNIPEWTKEVLGQAMTPEQFLANPQAQDMVYRTKFGQLAAKHGYEGASRAWFAGEGGMNDPNRKDQLGTSVQSYGQRFMNAFNSAGGEIEPPAVRAVNAAAAGGGPSPTQVAAEAPSEASAFTGSGGGGGGGVQVAGDVQTAAGRGGGGAAPGANAMPMPQGKTGIFIDPRFIPTRPGLTRDQFVGLMSNPATPDWQKKAAWEMMSQRGQPIVMPHPSGKGSVLINPNNPSQQMYMAAPPEQVEQKMGDLTTKGYDIWGPNGPTRIFPDVQEAPGPRSEAAPEATPSGGSGGGRPAGATPVVAKGETAPQPPAGATGAASAPGVQVASLDPSAGVQEAAAKSGTETPSTAPPGVKPPLAQLAAGDDSLRRMFGPRNVDAYEQYQRLQSQKVIREDLGKKQVEHGMKQYDAFVASSAAAQDLLPKVEGAMALLDDPRIHLGMASGAQDAWARFKEAIGYEPAANAPNELYDKYAAGMVLGTMKAALQGLGQVRLAEIDLLNKANASRFYGEAANRAVLEISKNGLEKIKKLGDMANQYVGGGDVVDPDTGQVLLRAGEGNRLGLDAGFNKLAQGWVEAQNKATTEHYKDYNSMFTSGKSKSGELSEVSKSPANVNNKKQWDNAPDIGTVDSGHRYNGGDPQDPNNWPEVPK